MRPALCINPMHIASRCHGFTYVELLIAVTISAVLVAGLMGVVYTATEVHDDVSQRNELAREARFAMQRMLRTVSHSPRLLLPQADSPNTNWPEHIREQTIPPSPPIGDSTLATAVLSVALPHDIDLDDDGTPDADNDGDGRIDEDPGGDNTNDFAQGIFNVDDDGDGSVDEGPQAADGNYANNDESGEDNDDFVDGIDNDLDGSVDEDHGGDMNNDTESGVAGVDDDQDGAIDEANRTNDDEDGRNNEDWIDPVVFYLDGNELKERLPSPWDINLDFQVNGRDTIISTLAENVTRFRVERIETPSGTQLVDLTLELTHPASGEVISLQTQVRVGGAL